MVAAYPNQATPGEVFKLIGGKVEENNFPSSCVVRLSRALNYAGQPIKRSASALTVSGADHRWYAFRVAEFVAYMTREYGAPQIVAQGEGGRVPTPATAFVGKRGVIAFEVTGWNDTTGHFDLWDGARCIHDAYFDRARKAMLWQAPP